MESFQGSLHGCRDRNAGLMGRDFGIANPDSFLIEGWVKMSENSEASIWLDHIFNDLTGMMRGTIPH